MLRLARAVLVLVGVVAAASGLAMAAGHVGLTSDDGLRIVFVGFQSGSYGIYWVNPANGVTRPIIAESAPEQLACSKVDNRIVFDDYVDSDTNSISIISANGTNRQDVVLTHPGVPDFQWSPDGQQISYTEGSREQSDIKLLRLSSSFPVTIIDTAILEAGATWSPDGRYLALDSSSEPGQWAVTLYDLQTSETTEIVVDQLDHHHAVWSPDNKRIAYVSYLDDVYSVNIFDIQSGEPSRLADGTNPSWSPDGSHLAINQYPQGFATIAILNMESGDVEMLSSTIRGLWPSPLWSPDGQQIAFLSITDDDSNNIWVMNADGSHLREVTHFSGDEYAPCWLYLQNFPEGN